MSWAAVLALWRPRQDWICGQTELNSKSLQKEKKMKEILRKSMIYTGCCKQNKGKGME